MMPVHIPVPTCRRKWFRHCRITFQFLAIGLGIELLQISSGNPVCSQDKPAAAATSNSSSLTELKPARLIFVDRHEVAFDRPGVLKFVLEEGDNVEKDQVIAKLEDRIAKAVVGEAEARVLNKAEILSAQKQAELAKVKYQSTLKNSKEYQAETAESGTSKGTSSTPTKNDRSLTPLYPQVYLDELRLSFEAAEADIGRFEKEHEVNQKGLLRALAELNALELRAPKAGLVTRAFKQNGEGIQSGEKVLEIISTQRIRVEIEVPAVTAARLQIGMPITVIVQQPTGEKAMDLERYPARLKFIDPTIGQVSQKVRIWTELDNSQGKLREGLVASIEVVPGLPATATTPQ